MIPKSSRNRPYFHGIETIHLYGPFEDDKEIWKLMGYDIWGLKKTYVFGKTRKHPPLKDHQLELDFAADGLPDL